MCEKLYICTHARGSKAWQMLAYMIISYYKRIFVGFKIIADFEFNCIQRIKHP